MANPTGLGGFKPGQSGNPNGRPKVNAEVVALAQAQTEDAIATLAEIMRDAEKPTASRVSAAVALLDRGHGKPAQPIGGTDDLPPINHSLEVSFVGNTG